MIEDDPTARSSRVSSRPSRLIIFVDIVKLPSSLLKGFLLMVSVIFRGCFTLCRYPRDFPIALFQFFRGLFTKSSDVDENSVANEVFEEEDVAEKEKTEDSVSREMVGQSTFRADTLSF